MKVMIVGSVPGSLVNFRGDLIRALVDQGHDVLACAPHGMNVELKVRELGARFAPVPFSRAGINPLLDLRTALKLFSLVRASAPDVVLCYTIKPIVYGITIARILRVRRTVALVTGLGYAFSAKSGRRRLLGTLAQLLYRLAFSCSSVVVFQNPDDRCFFETAIPRLRRKSAVVNGSGVNLRRYPQSPPAAEPTFLMVARLLKDKGVMEYLSAARSVKAEFPAARFLLVGRRDDNPASITEETLAGIRAEGVVECLGFMPDVRAILASAAVFVLPSYREGTPRTVLEALSTGRAVITTDAPGCRETVVDGYNGFLVPPKDARALAEAMTRFIERPELVAEFGTNSRRIAEEKYDVDKVNQTMIGLLDVRSTRSESKP